MRSTKIPDFSGDTLGMALTSAKVQKVDIWLTMERIVGLSCFSVRDKCTLSRQSKDKCNIDLKPQ